MNWHRNIIQVQLFYAELCQLPQQRKQGNTSPCRSCWTFTEERIIKFENPNIFKAKIIKHNITQNLRTFSLL